MFCSWISLLCYLIKVSEATVMDGTFFEEVCVEFEMIIPDLDVHDAKQCLRYQRTRNNGTFVIFPTYTAFIFPVSSYMP